MIIFWIVLAVWAAALLGFLVGAALGRHAGYRDGFHAGCLSATVAEARHRTTIGGDQ